MQLHISHFLLETAKHAWIVWRKSACREQQLCKSCDMEARIVQTTFELFLRDNEASCIFFTMPMAMITNLPAKGFRSKRRCFLIVSGRERTDSFRVLLTALSGEASPTFGHANANFSVFIDRIRNQFLKK